MPAQMTSAAKTYDQHRQQLSQFCQSLPTALAEIIHPDQQQELIETLTHACEALDKHNDWQLAQNWFFSFIGHHPQLTPIVPRSLLWFLGGDCLHFLGDDEIAYFQSLEDLMAEQDLDWSQALQHINSNNGL